jgi:carbon-monoxide dehydrogenase small subunit
MSTDPPDAGSDRSHERSTTLIVNGERVTRRIEPRQHLVDFLREELDLTGSHVGCEHGVCGACTVRVDGKIVRGCLMLAVQADGRRVDTIEGLTDSGELAELQEAFYRRNALQCGYCTPGMLICAADLLVSRPDATRAEIREHISGNYCRCTGYQAIVDAIETVLEARRKRGAAR